MQSDTPTKVLLALIFVALVVLVVQGIGRSDALSSGWGRYQVTGMRAGAPVLIRTDTVTGQVWKLELRGGHDTWVAFHEPATAEGGSGEAAQAGRESGGPADAARAERDVVEPPGAPPLPAEPPRASPEVLAALPPKGSSGATQQVDASQVAEFAKALRNEKLPTDMRAWVAAQLGKSKDPAATAALLSALGESEPEVVAASLRALAGRDDARVKAAAEKARTSGSEEVQRAARQVLESAR